jgi:hypothetical protein
VLSIRSDGRWLGGERVAPASDDPFAAALGAELEVEATAAVVALTPAQIVRVGLPWLHVDEVRAVGTPEVSEVAEFQAAIVLIAPHVAGDLVIDADAAGRIDPAVLQRCTVRIAGRDTARA